MPAPIARRTWSGPSGRAAAGVERHNVVNREKAVRNCASPRQHSAREIASSLQSGRASSTPWWSRTSYSSRLSVSGSKGLKKEDSSSASLAPSSGSSATGAEAAATGRAGGLEVSREDAEGRAAGCPRSRQKMHSVGREGGSIPPKAEATCAWALPYTAGSTRWHSSAASLVVTERPRALSSFKKVLYFLTPRDLRCWRTSSAIRSRSSRVAAGREGSLLRPLVPASKLSERGLPRVGRPWPGSILLSLPRTAPN